MKYFNETTKRMTLTKKFDYIKNHFTYWTMNSWNGKTTIANNIKIYNLPLTKEQRDRAYEIIGDENLCNELWDLYLNTYIYDFKRLHNDCYEMYINGRSDGYIVVNGLRGCLVMSEYINDADTYKQLVADIKHYYGCTYAEAQREARQQIEESFALIVDFDDTCDKMLDEFIYVIDNVNTETKTYTKECTYNSFVN